MHENKNFLGDCYYCVSGLPISLPNHAKNCVKMGLDVCNGSHKVSVMSSKSLLNCIIHYHCPVLTTVSGFFFVY